MPLIVRCMVLLLPLFYVCYGDWQSECSPTDDDFFCVEVESLCQVVSLYSSSKYSSRIDTLPERQN